MFTKRFKWLAILLFSLMLSGCGYFLSSEEEAPPPAPVEQVEKPETPEEANGEVVEETETNTEAETPEDAVNQELEAWMPRLDDVFYTYAGEGNEFASFTWYPQFNQENYYQVAEANPGTTLVEVFEYREDEIVRTFRLGEVYYRDNFTSIGTAGDGSPEEVVLQLPIEVGTTWAGAESDYEITAVNHEIEVPAGTFTTIEVSNIFEDSVTRRYYAEDVGLVLEVTEMEDAEVSSSLATIDTDVPEIISFTIYVPDAQAMGMDTVEAQLTLYTNDPARIEITKLLSGEVEGYEELKILPEGTFINYLFKNDSGIVEADVSSEFVDNMNAGSTGELFYIYNLVNTLLEYYGATEVLLTVEGEPYAGPHMVLEPGETLTFNQEMVNEVNTGNKYDK